MLASPFAFNSIVIFFDLATGATLSSIVTVAEIEDVLLLLSVAVSVTVLAPTLLQSKLVLLSDKDLMPQGSLEPSSISAAVILTFPEAFNCTVTFFTLAVGASLSETVTVKVHD